MIVLAMRKAVLLLLWCSVLGISVYAQKSFVLKSPAGNLHTTIVAGERLTYDVVCDGRQIMAPSAISMTLDNGTVWGNDVRIQKKRRKSVDETVFSPFYRTAQMRDHYNELVLFFKDHYRVEFRAYNDGIAYRFVSDVESPFKVISEQSDFNFPFDAVASVPYVRNWKMIVRIST